MREVIKYRLILLVSLLITVVGVEVTDTHRAARIALVGILIYFAVFGALLMLMLYVRRMAKAHHERARLAELRRRARDMVNNKGPFYNKQALGRIIRDLKGNSKYN